MRRVFCLMLGLALAASAALPANAAAGYRLLRLDGLHLKWDAPAFGAAAEVSYGFATADETFADAINCGALAPMRLLAEAWDRDEARLEAIAADAFAMWGDEAGIRFRRAGPGERADILIGAQGEPRRIAFTNVWHDTGASRDGVAPLTRATICFNPELPWHSDKPKAAIAERLDLRIVLAHEIGHAIGLDHPGPGGAIMGFRDEGMVDRLMPGDIAGARRLYGAPAD